ELRGIRAQHILRLFPLCKIARYLRKSYDLSVSVVKSGDDHTSPETTAIAAYPPSLVRGLAFPRSDPEKLLRKLALLIFFRIKNTQTLTNNLAGLISLDIFRTHIPVLNVTVLVEKYNGIILNL